MHHEQKFAQTECERIEKVIQSECKGVTSHSNTRQNILFNIKAIKR